MKNKQWMLRAVGVISALALGLGGLAACGNSSSAEQERTRLLSQQESRRAVDMG